MTRILDRGFFGDCVANGGKEGQFESTIELEERQEHNWATKDQKDWSRLKTFIVISASPHVF